MELEHGESLKLMKAIKKILDPKGILNPGKMFPAEKKQQRGQIESRKRFSKRKQNAR